jgi:hypothetical protein
LDEFCWPAEAFPFPFPFPFALGVGLGLDPVLGRAAPAGDAGGCAVVLGLALVEPVEAGWGASAGAGAAAAGGGAAGAAVGATGGVATGAAGARRVGRLVCEPRRPAVGTALPRAIAPDVVPRAVAALAPPAGARGISPNLILPSSARPETDVSPTTSGFPPPAPLEDRQPWKATSGLTKSRTQTVAAMSDPDTPSPAIVSRRFRICEGWWSAFNKGAPTRCIGRSRRTL